MQWWFCLIHKAVEQGAGCPNNSRLGPYENQEEAQGALGRIRARQEAADREEEAD